jgi:lipoprotein-anchoring transpeptidase ErfK/SrfK
MGNGYAIHGTNQPDSIGRAVSHGCVRLRNEDIAKLYAMVEVGTPVYIY